MTFVMIKTFSSCALGVVVAFTAVNSRIPINLTHTAATEDQKHSMMSVITENSLVSTSGEASGQNLWVLLNCSCLNVKSTPDVLVTDIFLAVK